MLAANKLAAPLELPAEAGEEGQSGERGRMRPRRAGRSLQGVLQPGGSLFDQSADEPVLPEACRHPEAVYRPSRVRRTPMAGGPEVGLILIEAARPKILVLAVKPCGHVLAQVGEVGAMPGSDLFQLSRCHELLMGKCLDGLQQPVAGSGGGVLGLNQRLVNQGGEQPGYLAAALPAGRAPTSSAALQRPSSGEDSKPTEQCLLCLAE